MKKITVKRNQTLADIALLCYGDVAGVFRMVALNENLLGPMDTLHAGQTLLVDEAPLKPLMTQHLAPYDIATGLDAFGEGISFWTINQDFIVQ